MLTKMMSFVHAGFARLQMPVLFSASGPRIEMSRREVTMHRVLFLGLIAAMGLSAGVASAFTAPAAGSLGYDVYDVVVNQLLSGPIGFVGGVILIVFGATQVMKQWLITVLCVIAGTVIIKAQSITTSLGALVH